MALERVPADIRREGSFHYYKKLDLKTSLLFYPSIIGGVARMV